MTESEFVTAKEAADMLGVSVATLYVYVGRKNLRSQPVAGTREKRYLRSDIEREVQRKNAPRSAATAKDAHSEITRITPEGPTYRGVSAIELSETATLEEVAGLLWDVDPRQVFTDEAPRSSPRYEALVDQLQSYGSIDRAALLLPMLEDGNPRSFDLTPDGMARTGSDILRWLAAILFREREAVATPIQQVIAAKLQWSEALSDLARRTMILSADHGLEAGARAVRAVASTGVTPWRSVCTGLLVAAGRENWLGYGTDVRQLVDEVLDGPDPREPILRRLRQGQTVPGFEAAIYEGHDPRGRALFKACDDLLGDDEDIRRLNTALEVVRDWSGLEPDFPLARIFVNRKLGLKGADPLYALARSAGWIAHAIEQYAEDDRRRIGTDRSSHMRAFLPPRSG